MGVTRQTVWLDMGLLFGFALIVRIVYLVSLSGDPWLHHTIVDETIYRRMALAFRHGAWDELFPLYRPALWPLLQAGWLSLVGENVSFLFTRLLNVVLGSLTVPLGYLLARKLSGRSIALWSGVLAALAGVLVHLSVSGLTTPLFMVLLLGAILIGMRAASGNGSLPLAAFAGLLWGLAVLARPLALILAVVSAGWLVWKLWRIGRERSLATGLLLLVATAVPLLPGMTVNSAFGDFNLLTSNGGVNFYFGNYPGSSGYMAVHPEFGPTWSEEEARLYASQQSGRDLRPSEASTWYYTEGLRGWTRDPGAMLNLYGRKLVMLLGGVEIGNNGDWRFFAETRPVLRVLLLVGWWWLLPLAVLGALVAPRNPERGYILLIAGGYLLTVLAFFITSRFRIPVLPLLAPFAVIGLGWLFRAAASRQPIRVAAVVGFIILVFGLNTLAERVGPPPDRAYGAVLQAILHKDAGQVDDAVHWFGVALEANPTTPSANLYLGEYARANGNLAAAIRHYREEISLKPRVRAWRGLGLAYREIGRHDSAAAAFGAALAMEPADTTVRLAYAEELGELALDAMDQARFRSADSLFALAATIAPENPFFSFGRATALYKQQRSDRADALMDSLGQHHPAFPPVVQWQAGWRPD